MQLGAALFQAAMPVACDRDVPVPWGHGVFFSFFLCVGVWVGDGRCCFKCELVQEKHEMGLSRN